MATNTVLLQDQTLWAASCKKVWLDATPAPLPPSRRPPCYHTNTPAQAVGIIRCLGLCAACCHADIHALGICLHVELHGVGAGRSRRILNPAPRKQGQAAAVCAGTLCPMCPAAPLAEANGMTSYPVKLTDDKLRAELAAAGPDVDVSAGRRGWCQLGSLAPPPAGHACQAATHGGTGVCAACTDSAACWNAAQIRLRGSGSGGCWCAAAATIADTSGLVRTRQDLLQQPAGRCPHGCRSPGLGSSG